MLRSCTDVLRQQQRNFDVTGGLHAAAILTADARVLAVREDIGRHNAVDKAIGALLIARERTGRRPQHTRVRNGG